MMAVFQYKQLFKDEFSTTQDLYQWSWERRINKYVAVGMSPGLTSKTINWANGYSTFESNLVDYKDLISVESSGKGPLLFFAPDNVEILFRIARIYAATVCQSASANAYCILMAPMQEKYKLTENLVEGNVMIPNDCLMECKTQNLTVSTFKCFLTRKCQNAFNETIIISSMHLYGLITVIA